MNIVLIGYRGSGKSTVGRRLASRMGKRFVDTDDLIESREGEIGEMVKSHGWAYFRAAEKKTIEEVSKDDDLVIALGGGAVLDADNVRNLKRNGQMIWLKADPEVLRRRMMEDRRTPASRPALTGKGAIEELEDVMVYRGPFYEKAARIHVETSTFDAEAVVEKILTALKEVSGRN